MPVRAVALSCGWGMNTMLFILWTQPHRQEETQLAGEDENPRNPFGLCWVAFGVGVVIIVAEPQGFQEYFPHTPLKHIVLSFKSPHRK